MQVVNVMPAILSVNDLKQIAAAASQVIGFSQAAWQLGDMSPVRDQLKDTHEELCSQLAAFEDGRGYGKAPSNLLIHLRLLEQIAADLLKADSAVEGGKARRPQ
jgi:hypothetical protein